ncbi:DUF4123 domain-containing protein [Pseudovibrio brasiliensis]|uniref:DUF4123 domain-containing protein n=1 Tax=Pseudovibrio brasiliensis TaxID=1898042 RepID=A0ABX8AVH3_9HYPH|nr:DUF4123 domain-containing protein [Pseudovibrio brasiliensis]QUS59062.1 DUF4123 domain-containing protein [Pseudovibrio brasiliensis]
MVSLTERFKAICAQAATIDAKPYLVLDASWQEDLASEIRATGENGWEPLMGSPAEDKQDAHARTPLLVDLTIHPAVLSQWLEEGFPEKLGIIVFSTAAIEELRTSLKRFLSVITPESGKPVYLRFYDARVLYCFLRHGFPEQWQDFFKNIDLIAAPYDYTSSFAVYRLRGEQLQLGIETEDGLDYHWHKHENQDRAVENYRATFPFREIEQRQYDDMMHCAQVSFYHEIEQFLRKAFPKETSGVLRKDLIEFIGAQEKVAINEGFNGENCALYWVLMTMICGTKFYEEEYMGRYLSIPWFSHEKRLLDILAAANGYAENPHIQELTIEVS